MKTQFMENYIWKVSLWQIVGTMGKWVMGSNALLITSTKAYFNLNKWGSKGNKEDGDDIIIFQNHQCHSHFLEFSVMSKYDLMWHNMNGLLIEK